jgi:hypothetical protein
MLTASIERFRSIGVLQMASNALDVFYKKTDTYEI